MLSRSKSLRFTCNESKDGKWLIIDKAHSFPVCETYDSILAEAFVRLLNAYGSQVAEIMDGATYGPSGD